MDNHYETNTEKIKENLQTQLNELETLQAVYYNPGEIRVEDPCILADIQAFVNNANLIIPPYLDLTINLLIDEEKFELGVSLPHEYPETKPDLFVRNSSLNRTQHTKLNKELNDYVEGLNKGEPCIFSAVTWLQDNVTNYLNLKQTVDVEERNKIQVVDNENLIRFWIYSHHIYSKTKRREIVDLANTLNITGFSMPGKPGIICVEGTISNCNEWWITIKSMNWKRIFCKITEECKEEDREGFLKFNSFKEMVFQNNNIKNNHMDMGELYKFLEKQSCGYIFKELFGVDAKSSN